MIVLYIIITPFEKSFYSNKTILIMSYKSIYLYTYMNNKLNNQCKAKMPSEYKDFQ